jgi:glycosyltransferase involved in cell wall biosynthesis
MSLRAYILTVVIPCYNEEQTLAQCISRVLAIQDNALQLEIIIVDDCSTDGSANVARRLAAEHPHIVYCRHARNMGKGAALRTGFSKATGDFVAVQDADLEYDPQDLKKLLVPLLDGTADVVFGSRFLSGSAHRVLYFWHSLGNTFLTLLSNMLTDLNLTDMETCYKVFKREIIQSIALQENRFGFEPEVVAKIAQMRVRIYEIGIAYYGRTYAEGKKIGMRDGWRALYCILKYNLHKAPWPVQFLFYIGIGGVSALVNLAVFLLLYGAGFSVNYAAPGAFLLAAGVNYMLSITILFRHRSRWKTLGEVGMFLLVTGVVGSIDLYTTRFLLLSGIDAAWAKISSSFIGLGLNFAGRRWLVFPEPSNPDWAPQGMPAKIPWKTL